MALSAPDYLPSHNVIISIDCEKFTFVSFFFKENLQDDWQKKCVR
jgi:hypothetical protein